MVSWLEVESSAIKSWVSLLWDTGYVKHLSTISGYQDGDRICLVYHFLQREGPMNVRTCVPLANPHLPSITPILPGAVLYEREIQDLLGLYFEGITDGRRLILPEHLPKEIHPLRKDFQPKVFTAPAKGEEK